MIKNLTIQSRYDYSKVKNTIQDIITSTDPYAASKADGDALVRDLLDIMRFSRKLSDASVDDIADSIMSMYSVSA